MVNFKFGSMIKWSKEKIHGQNFYKKMPRKARQDKPKKPNQPSIGFGSGAEAELLLFDKRLMVWYDRTGFKRRTTISVSRS